MDKKISKSHPNPIVSVCFNWEVGFLALHAEGPPRPPSTSFSAWQVEQKEPSSTVTPVAWCKVCRGKVFAIADKVEASVFATTAPNFGKTIETDLVFKIFFKHILNKMENKSMKVSCSVCRNKFTNQDMHHEGSLPSSRRPGTSRLG